MQTIIAPPGITNPKHPVAGCPGQPCEHRLTSWTIGGVEVAGRCSEPCEHGVVFRTEDFGEGLVAHVVETARQRSRPRVWRVVPDVETFLAEYDILGPVTVQAVDGDSAGPLGFRARALLTIPKDEFFRVFTGRTVDVVQHAQIVGPDVTEWSVEVSDALTVYATDQGVTPRSARGKPTVTPPTPSAHPTTTSESGRSTGRQRRS